jgi:uncharacterized membrane protein YidH (DUF202 family)
MEKDDNNEGRLTVGALLIICGCITIGGLGIFLFAQSVQSDRSGFGIPKLGPLWIAVAAVFMSICACCIGGLVLVIKK